MDLMNMQKRPRLFSVAEVLIIVLLALVPLLMNYPYRVNIFLSWEGAYRLSQGQIPYKDFGMPLGYMYWVVPALFFKIFGVQMLTLIKAQAFLNIVSGLAFRSVLKSLNLQPGVVLLSVVLYCISYSFFNFWPWYNHSVMVYEMVALAFLLKYIAADRQRWYFLTLAGLFTFFSFFTKQDGGGLAFALCLALLTGYGISQQKWKPLLIYVAAFLAAAVIIIAPLTRFNFWYWFNHGQPPHTSRISIAEIASDFLMDSQWIKFYLFLTVLIGLAAWQKLRKLFFEKNNLLLLLLTTGILAEAAILQVTSYTPPDNNIFFHSFAFAFIASWLVRLFNINLLRIKPMLLVGFCLMLWWSGAFWKYLQRLLPQARPQIAASQTAVENIVNRHTYLIYPPTGEIPMHQWTFSGLPVFKGIYMPEPTVKGIHRLLNQPEIKTSTNLKVLNMTELTPLAVAMPYQLERGPGIPLWYHLGVSMFNKQAAAYEQKIAANYYDWVLFEYVPSLNNFYPFRVRDTLLQHYQKIDSFPAPRSGNTQGVIEVFRRHNK